MMKIKDCAYLLYWQYGRSKNAKKYPVKIFKNFRLVKATCKSLNHQLLYSNNHVNYKFYFFERLPYVDLPENQMILQFFNQKETIEDLQDTVNWKDIMLKNRTQQMIKYNKEVLKLKKQVQELRKNV